MKPEDMTRLQLIAEVRRLQLELRDVDSYVQHAGQDVDGEWIHRKIRAALAAKPKEKCRCGSHESCPGCAGALAGGES